MYLRSDDGIDKVILVNGAFDKDVVCVDILTELGERQRLEAVLA
jgi:hypothetical protein